MFLKIAKCYGLVLLQISTCWSNIWNCVGLEVDLTKTTKNELVQLLVRCVISDEQEVVRDSLHFMFYASLIITDIITITERQMRTGLRRRPEGQRSF